jgi:phosphoribosylanthranilate isomerase
MKVKVCGMREKHNIEAIARLKPDYMGFIFYTGSPRFVGTQLIPETIYALSPEIRPVGVFVNEELYYVNQLAQKYGFEYIQLHGLEKPDYCKTLKDKGLKIIKAFHLHDNFDFSSLIPYKPVCDFFLFDNKGETYGGTGEHFGWDILKYYDNEVPVFLSGGISLNDLEDIKNLKNHNIHAVDVNSRFELEPGIKDISKVKKLLEKRT